MAFADGYNWNVAVVNKTWMAQILLMAEFRDPMAGFNYQRTGELPGPLGATWHKWSSTGSTSFSTDRILAIDNTCALLGVTEGGVLTEANKIIEKQIEGTQVTKWSGFAKFDYEGTHCLDITA
jgi:hypothetical protein